MHTHTHQIEMYVGFLMRGSKKRPYAPAQLLRAGAGAEVCNLSPEYSLN